MTDRGSAIDAKNTLAILEAETSGDPSKAHHPLVSRSRSTWAKAVLRMVASAGYPTD
ncbi:MAG: hypothetical protein L0H78_14855 [Humibacillus sp.]|nr:hypothetical protein [Humibacillus sp.]